jgi:hypothetical protein
MSATENGSWSTLVAVTDHAIKEADTLEREAETEEHSARAKRQRAAFLRAVHGGAQAYLDLTRRTTEPPRPVLVAAKEDAA